jgi:hypothetical protein
MVYSGTASHHSSAFNLQILIHRRYRLLVFLMERASSPLRDAMACIRLSMTITVCIVFGAHRNV